MGRMQFHSMSTVMVLLAFSTSVARAALYNVSDYRLINKTRARSGIVEAYVSELNVWSIICNGNNLQWSFEHASMVCGRLGYPGTALALFAINYDADDDNWSREIVYDAGGNLSCQIRDGNYLWCRSLDPTEECSPQNVLAVTCKGPGYLGCYIDPCTLCIETVSIIGRTLSSVFREDTTVDSCINWCNEGNYMYAGVENGRQCFCGNDDYSRYGRVNDSECYMPCSGDDKDTCGGAKRISVYNIQIAIATVSMPPHDDGRGDDNTSTETPTSSTSRISDESQFTVTSNDDKSPDDTGGGADKVATTPSDTKPSMDTPTSRTSGTSDKSKGDSNRHLIITAIACVLAVVLAIIVVIIVVFLLKRRGKATDKSSPLDDSNLLSLAKSAGGTNVYEESGEDVPSTERGRQSSLANHNYDSIRTGDDYSDINDIALSAIPISEPSGGGDLYTNAEFHEVPQNLVENELYGK